MIIWGYSAVSGQSVLDLILLKFHKLSFFDIWKVWQGFGLQRTDYRIMGYFKIFCVFSALLWAKLIFSIPPKNAVYHASKAAKTLSGEKNGKMKHRFKGRQATECKICNIIWPGICVYMHICTCMCKCMYWVQGWFWTCWAFISP